MVLVRFCTGDILVMKKKHPCSSDRFIVTRCGSDIKIRCSVCSRELTLSRDKLEKMIKSVESADKTK